MDWKHLHPKLTIPPISCSILLETFPFDQLSIQHEIAWKASRSWTAWPCTFGSIGQLKISIFYLCSACNENIPSLKIYIKVERYPSKCLIVNLVTHQLYIFFFAAEFSIWTREAGAGGLSIAVEGPSKAEIAFEDRKDGSCGVSYIVQEPGIYCRT